MISLPFFYSVEKIVMIWIPEKRMNEFYFSVSVLLLCLKVDAYNTFNVEFLLSPFAVGYVYEWMYCISCQKVMAPE